MKTVAFLINPVAGSGLDQNLKDSDLLTGSSGSSRSISEGEKFLQGVQKTESTFLVPSGIMGGDSLAKFGLKFEIITSPGKVTTRRDTIEFVKAASSRDCDLLVFVGGDGTARDILSSIRNSIPVLGIPAGIKMYSSVFAVSVNHAVDLFDKFVEGEGYEVFDGEVADLDSGYFRGEKFKINYFGDMKVIGDSSSPRFSKSEVQADDISGIIEFVTERMIPDVYYFIGPGSTCKAITKKFGAEPELLGIDIIRDGRIVKLDASEADLIKFGRDKSMVIVSPLGGQGFLLGRGNRQITGKVMSLVGFDNLIVIASRSKMENIRNLFIDIDFPEESIPKYLRVIIGYGETRMVKTVFR